MGMKILTIKESENSNRIFFFVGFSHTAWNYKKNCSTAGTLRKIKFLSQQIYFLNKMFIENKIRKSLNFSYIYYLQYTMT